MICMKLIVVRPFTPLPFSMNETLIKMCLKWDFPDTNRKRKHKE